MQNAALPEKTQKNKVTSEAESVKNQKVSLSKNVSKERVKTEKKYKNAGNGVIREHTIITTSEQEQQLSAIDAVFKAIKRKIVTHDSIDTYDQYGNFIKSGANAYFDPKTNVYHIALDNVGEAYMHYAVHETVHDIAANNKRGYKTLEKIVLETLENKGEDINELIEIQRKLVSGQTEAYYLEEVVANTVPVILKDSKTAAAFAKRFAAAGKQTRSVFEKLLDGIRKLLAKAHDVLRRNKSFKQMKVVEADLKAIANIRKTYFDALEVVVKQQGNGTGEEYVIRYSKNDKNTTSIKEQLRANQDKVNSLDPVTNIKNKGWKGLTRAQQIQTVRNEFKTFGAKIDRIKFGTILLDDKRIFKGFNYINREAEYAAFFAVLHVIKRGIEISGHQDHKGRGLNTITFAAPVVINGVKGNVAVVVKRDTRNMYKMHRILMPDGAMFEFKPENNNTEPTSSGGISNSENGGSPISSVSKIRLTQKVKTVKKDEVRYSIKEGMTDEERYNELKEAKVEVAVYDGDKSKLTKAEVDKLERSTRREARKYVKQLFEKFGVVGRYANKEIDIEFEFSKRGFDKSLHEQTKRTANYSDFGKMLACFGDIVKNAVPIEIHTDKYIDTKRADDDLKRVFVLVSAINNNEIVPVQLNIKEFAQKDNLLYVAVALNKIEAEVLASESHHKGDPHELFPASNISIRELFKNINPVDGEFLKYVPNGFLNDAQRASKYKALEKERSKIEGYRFSLKDTQSRGRSISSDNISIKEMSAKDIWQWYNEWFKEHKTEYIAQKQEIIERFKEAEAKGDIAEMNKQRKEYKALDQWSEETIRDKKVQIGKAVGGVVKLGGEKVADKTGIGANATDIGAIATDIGANAVEYEEISTLDNLLINTKNLDEAKTAISEIDISNLSITDLNKLLRDSGKISGLSLNEVALLKSDIIKQAGFVNFDWKAIGDEVKGFVNMDINVVELDDKITLFRRGYPNEPSSQYGLGRWWGDKYRTIEEVRNEFAVLEEWGNPLTGEYTITVPRGIRVLTGLAASQKAIDELGNTIESRGGGAIQYWLNDIPNDWLLN